MKSITFVTGNQRKLRDMRKACAQFGIEVEQVDLGMDEIQSHDPIKISHHKAQQAFELAGGDKPVVINDAFWSIPALKGFPGGYMKDVMLWFEPNDFLLLMQDKTDRRISCTETVIYKDGTTTKEISKTFWGDITSTGPRGDGDSMEQIIEIKGKTLAEYHSAHESAFMQYIWEDFAEWFDSFEVV